jgi:hypothetical protein
MYRQSYIAATCSGVTYVIKCMSDIRLVFLCMRVELVGVMIEQCNSTKMRGQNSVKSGGLFFFEKRDSKSSLGNEFVKPVRLLTCKY